MIDMRVRILINVHFELIKFDNHIVEGEGGEEVRRILNNKWDNVIWDMFEIYLRYVWDTSERYLRYIWEVSERSKMRLRKLSAVVKKLYKVYKIF